MFIIRRINFLPPSTLPIISDSFFVLSDEVQNGRNALKLIYLFFAWENIH